MLSSNKKISQEVDNIFGNYQYNKIIILFTAQF